jgi:hypothetical protein
MQTIVLKYLKKYGQLLDSEIAAGTGLSLAEVKQHIDALAGQGDVITCKVTRFVGDQAQEGILCRASGYAPPASPGRKPGNSGTPSAA